MIKYFSATARHVKAREFLELKQGTMTVMKYMAKFTELARVADDYVAIDMAKVRKFLGWFEVFHLGKDCRIPPTRYEHYGQDGYGHRER